MQNQHQPQTISQSMGRDTAGQISDGKASSKSENLLHAEAQARQLSKQHSVWYVRQTGADTFEPWAHDSEDGQTVATFMSGKRFSEEAEKATKYFTCAETAKMVRTSLKEAFADVKFSVRSSTYSGGASITVEWTDGPSEAQVKTIVGVFNGSYFDGMIDFKGSIYHAIDGVDVRFGADSIHYVRRDSDAAVERAIEEVKRRFGDALRSAGMPMPTVAGFQNGDYICGSFIGDASEETSLQNAIRRALCEHSDRVQVGKSKTAAKVIITGDDGYSRQCGSGFSALSVAE